MYSPSDEKSGILSFTMSVHHEVISISKSYHDTVEFYIHNFWKLLAVTLIPSLLTAILFLSMTISTFSALYQFSLGDTFFSTTNGQWTIVGGIFLTILVVDTLGLIALVMTVAHDGRVHVLHAFENSLVYFWRFVGLGLFLFVVSIIGLFVGFAILAIIGIILGSFSLNLVDTVFVWFDPLVTSLTASAFTVFFIFAKFIVIEENKSLGAALLESMRLVHGHFWPVAIRVLLAYVVSSAIALGIYLLPQVGSFLALAVVTPLPFIYLWVLYHDLKALKT